MSCCQRASELVQRGRGQDAALYVRRDARRYVSEQLPLLAQTRSIALKSTGDCLRKAAVLRSPINSTMVWKA
jgi:hypothetical protein